MGCGFGASALAALGTANETALVLGWSTRLGSSGIGTAALASALSSVLATGGSATGSSSAGGSSTSSGLMGAASAAGSATAAAGAASSMSSWTFGSGPPTSAVGRLSASVSAM